MKSLRLFGALVAVFLSSLTGAAQTARFQSITTGFDPSPTATSYLGAYHGTTDANGNQLLWLRYRGDFTFGGVFHASPADTLVRQALVKLNPAGGLLWLREVTDQEGIVGCVSLNTDAAGNVYALGRVCCSQTSYLIDGMPISGQGFLGAQAWVAKWAPTGAIQYATAVAHSPNGDINPWRLAVSATGELAITSNFVIDAVVGTDTLQQQRSFNGTIRVSTGFVAKFSNSGAPLWARQTLDADTLTTSFPMELDFDAAGELRFVGYYGNIGGQGAHTSIGGVALPTSGGIFHVTLGPAGQVRHALATAIPPDDLLAYAVAPDGTSYCAFTLGRPTTLGPGQTLRFAGRKGAFVVCYAPDGSTRWIHTISGSDSADFVRVLPRMLTLSEDDRIIVGGTEQGIIRDGSVQMGQPAGTAASYPGHVWVLALNALGEPLWGHTLHSARGEYAWQLQPLPGGDVSLLAHTISDSVGLGSLAVVAPGNFHSKLLLARITQQYNTLTGAAYLDANANNIQDATEGGFPGGLVVEVNPGNIPCAAPEATGHYDAYVDLAVNYTASLPTPPPHYTVVAQGPPATTFSTYGNVAAGRSFALQPIANQQDVQVLLLLVSPARPGNLLTYQVQYRNTGTVPISAGSVTLAYDAQLQLHSTSQSPTATAPTALTWTYANLLPGETRRLNAVFRLPATTPLGGLVSSTATLEPLVGDLEPADNLSTARRTITGSYDPNDIEVNHILLSTQQVQNGEWLEYTIRFQNHGSDTAFAVTIRDSLSASLLQLSTLQIRGATHNCAWSISPSGQLLIQFPDINLPSQTTNSLASDGAVVFRVRPVNTLLAGDQIPNQARICFDYNAPLATNTALTVVQSALGAPGGAAADPTVLVWPNPASGTLHVEATRPQDGELTLTLVDALGRTVRTQVTAASAHSLSRAALDVSGLPAGLYVLRGQDAGQPFARPVVVR